jgi:S-phase kinase-associated protein 1
MKSSSTTTTTNKNKTVKLIAANQKEIIVPIEVACQSRLVADVLADDEIGSETPPVPLPNLKIETLIRVIEFCTRHVDNPCPKIEKPIRYSDMHAIVGEEDADFINSFEDLEQLFDIILAANYLDIESLLDLGCAKIASMMKGKTPAQVRAQFGIETPTVEEEAQIKKDHEWIFDTVKTTTTTTSTNNTTITQ